MIDSPSSNNDDEYENDNNYNLRNRFMQRGTMINNNAPLSSPSSSFIDFPETPSNNQNITSNQQSLQNIYQVVQPQSQLNHVAQHQHYPILYHESQSQTQLPYNNQNNQFLPTTNQQTYQHHQQFYQHQHQHLQNQNQNQNQHHQQFYQHQLQDIQNQNQNQQYQNQSNNIQFMQTGQLQSDQSNDNGQNYIINLKNKSRSDFDFALKMLCYLRDGAVKYKHYNVLIIYQLIEDIFRQLNSVRSNVNETGINQLKANVQHISYHRFLNLFIEKGLLPKNHKSISTNEFLNYLNTKFMELTDSVIMKRSINNNNELTLFKNGISLGSYKQHIDDEQAEMNAIHEANSVGLTNKVGRKRRTPNNSFKSTESQFDSQKSVNTTIAATSNPGMLINPNNLFLHQNPNNNLRNNKYIESVKTTIDYPSTVRRFLQKQKQQNSNITKITFEEFNSSLVLYTELGQLLFPNLCSLSYDINNNGEIIKCYDTLFSCLAKRMNVQPVSIENTIMDFITNNMNNESFLSLLYEKNSHSNDQLLTQSRRNLLQVHIADIKSHNITDISTPFLFHILPIIFPDYKIIVFRFEIDELIAMYYPKDLSEKNLPCADSNTISIIKIYGIYKLLIPMNPFNSITNDSDDD